MDFKEDQLPQKQQLPRALRIYGREDSEWRENCPINGTRLFDKPKPLTLEAKSAYSSRKARARKMARKRELGGETQGEGSGGNMAKRRRMSSSIPSIVRFPTPIPQGAFHVWSIDDPLGPTVLIAQQPPPTHASTAPIHFSHPSTNPTEAHDQCAANSPSSGINTQSQSLYTINDASGVMADARAAHSSSTTLDIETDNGPPSTNQDSWQPQTRCAEGPAMSTALSSAFDASAPGPALSAEQDKGWLTDEFIATYQSFFVPCSPSSRHLDQALAPELGQYYADTPHRAISEPVPLVCSPATIHNTGTISATVCNGIRKQGPLDMNRGSIATYADQPDSKEPIAWSAPPVVAVQINEPPCHMVGTATDFGYALNYATDVHNPLPAIPSNIHPRPPKLSSYSELAPASIFPASAFADHDILPPMDALTATFHITTPSAFANAPLHDNRSARVLGTYSQDPVYLTQPYVVREVAVKAGEYARALEGGIKDMRESSSADIKLLHPGVDLATGQVLDAVSEVDYTRFFQEGTTHSNRLLSSKAESLPLSQRAIWQQQRHDVPMNSF